ncbi:MAG: hypothetical protein FD123_3164 [Bacteroidetes bacterium]|nr:MAG: hypothetical protein FD123_3164 [Bacteroidota bacterium]
MPNDKNNSSPGYQPGDTYHIPPEGSLALLALGARGLDLWRKKRAEAVKEKKENPSGPDERKEKE